MSGVVRAETRILMGAYGQADIARLCTNVGGTFTNTPGRFLRLQEGELRWRGRHL